MAEEYDYCEKMGCDIRKKNCKKCSCFLECDEWELSTTGKIIRAGLIITGIVIAAKILSGGGSD